VKTQNLNIKMLGKNLNNKESWFPYIIELSESESNLEDCNLFLEDYDAYMQQNDWFKIWDAPKDGNLQWNEKNLWELHIVLMFFFSNFKCVEFYFK
jgi:hypothetical protein